MKTSKNRKLPRRSSLAIAVTIAIWSVGCSSKSAQPPTQGPASMQMSTAPAGSCQIDAVKMCQATGSQSAAQSASAPMAGSYGPSNLPESVEFQIPAGQNIKLMCYYDSQHSAVYKADATPDSALTDNSVDYMKKQGFCSNK